MLTEAYVLTQPKSGKGFVIYSDTSYNRLLHFFLGALTGHSLGVFPVCIIKALALKEACLWLESNSFSYIDIKTNAKVMVNAVSSVMDDCTEFGYIILDVKTCFLKGLLRP